MITSYPIRKIRSSFTILLLFLLLAACTNNSSNEPAVSSGFDTIIPRFAKGFRILQNDKIKKIQILNDDLAVYEYIIGDTTLIANRGVVCLSSTQIAMLDFIDETNSIKGITSAKHCFSEKIKGGVAAGKILEVGIDEALNIEKIIGLNPAVVFTYSNSSALNNLDELKKQGIKLVMINEYLEKHPLGKAEWGKVVALFFGKLKIFEDKFDSVVSDYQAISQKAKQCDKKPTVFMGSPWKDVWYMAGSESYAARLIEDAGGHYVYKNKEHKDVYPFDFETVYAECAGCDFWINIGSFNSKEELLAADKRFSNFSSFRNGLLFNNNKRQTPDGGNDYWESGVMYPNRILSDLVQIFHPEIANKKELYYYQKLY